MRTTMLLSILVVVVLTVIPGCQGASQNEPVVQDSAEDLQTKLTACETSKETAVSEAVEEAKKVAEEQLNKGYQTALSEKDQEISKLKEEIAALEQTNQELVSVNALASEWRNVSPSTHVTSHAELDELRVAVETWYPNLSSFQLGLVGTRDFDFTTRENLERFLEADSSNNDRMLRPRPASNLGDHAAFLFKVRWIEAGLPAGSIGLMKCDRGEGSHWRNLFITKEDEEIVFYEVVPNRDQIIKITEPSTGKTDFLTVQNRLF
jgi:vacuolar-type H+-ATPase subunit H